MTERHHLAQANIARARAPLTDPIMEGFVEQLQYINTVADRSPGFVWRLQTDDGDATAVRIFNDPLLILNMSVWESVEPLFDYVFRSDHLGPLRERHRWFERIERPHSVLWWIRRGALPGPSDAEYRLDFLDAHGPTPTAFTFSRLFDPAGKRLQRDSRIDRGCGV